MGAIREFLSADHDRLDALLSTSLVEKGVNEPACESFRRGLLKHVGMEEMILLPAAKKLSGHPARLAERARLDHGALTALLVPTPTPAIIRALRSILGPHNRMEEEGAGLYDECEATLGSEASAVLDRLRQAKEIPPAVHADGDRVAAVVRRALDAAGYASLEF